MKKVFITILIPALLTLLLFSCNDPVFHMVSQDRPALKPHIPGAPTNFVVYKDAIYVASGKRIWSYNNIDWTNGINVQPALEGHKWIGDIAATDEFLYIIIFTSSGNTSNGALWKSGDPSNPNSWIQVQTKEENEDLNIQTIFAAGSGAAKRLFFSIRKYRQNIYDIYYLSDELAETPTSNRIIEGTIVTNILRGAAYDGENYYLAAGSIFKGTLESLSIISELPPGTNFLGIINTSPIHIAAISNDGTLYSVNPANGTPIHKLTGISNNGALAVWSNGTHNLLLAGRRNGSPTFGGYMEMDIAVGGSISPDARFREPGIAGEISSVNSSSRFITSIGKRSVNFLFQAPNPEPEGRLFASTHLDGVWSYRDRPNDGWGWNAEQQ